MKNTVFTLMVLFVGGCSPASAPVTDISGIPKGKLQAAYQIKTYTTENKNHPEVAEYCGSIKAYSYKHLWGRPASKEDALTKLKLKALEFGAEGIIDITFDTSGTNTWGTNGWGSIQASGIAVKFKNNK
jgi:hypothetical protein